MTKTYITVTTTALVGGGFAGINAVVGAEYCSPLGISIPKANRTSKEVEALQRAETAAEAVFRATGRFPGSARMSARVRVDGGRAVVCASRGRWGW